MTLLDQANIDDVNPPLCERCNKPFTARSGSGGKPQRFCSSECRTASHTDSQRSQRQDDQQNVGKTSALVTLGTPLEQDTTEEDFDWSGENVVIRKQPATAIYFNPNGALVIRQQADYPDDDPFVYISADHIEAFLDKLTDVYGVMSFP
jgi:hypothetical protein